MSASFDKLVCQAHLDFMPDEYNSVSEISTISSFAVNHVFSIKKAIAMFKKRHFHVLSKLTIQIFVEQSPVFLSHE